MQSNDCMRTSTVIASIPRLRPASRWSSPRGFFMHTRIALCLLTTMLLTGCGSSKPQSTRMTAEDLTEMSEAMAQSLAQSDALRDRTAGSTPWVISIDRVQNLTKDIITESERWYVIQRLRSSLPIRAMSQQKNITFVIPRERLDAIRNNPKIDVSDDPNFGSQRTPTHQMNAKFIGGERADATNRTDTYYCEFEIMNLATGVPEWTDRFEYKRTAKGHVWD